MHQMEELSNREAAILSRVILAEQDDLSPAAAKAFLKLHFKDRDRERMHELAVKNQDGDLREAEQDELDSYRHVGRLLDLLGARAPVACQAWPQCMMEGKLPPLVWQRAHHRCKYCRLPQAYSLLIFEIDHIIARKHGGRTVQNNLALPCYYWAFMKASRSSLIWSLSVVHRPCGAPL